MRFIDKQDKIEYYATLIALILALCMFYCIWFVIKYEACDSYGMDYSIIAGSCVNRE